MVRTFFRLMPELVLADVSINAAQVLDLKDRGILKVGTRADIAHRHISLPSQLSCPFGVNKLSNLWILGRIN